MIIFRSRLIDYLTRFCFLGALKHKDKHTVAAWIVEHVFLKQGASESLLSGQGSEFTNDELDAICKLLNIRKRHGSTAHPQSQGLVERLNKKILQVLKAYLIDSNNVYHWPSILAYAEFAINTAYHSTVSETPFFLMYGRDPYLPVDAWLPGSQQPPYDISMYKSVHVQRLREASNLASHCQH